MMQLSQTSLSSLVSKDRLSETLARLSMSYGLGLMAGTSIGGVVFNRYGQYPLVCLCVVAASLDLIIHIFVLNEFELVIKEKDVKENSDSDYNKINLMKEYIHLFDKDMVLILATQFILMSGWKGQTTVFRYIAIERLGIDIEE